MKALVLGDKSQAGMFFRGQDVEYVNEGPFDAILLASHLQIVQRQHVATVIQQLYDTLNDGGHFIVTVPALEWACRQICTQNDIPISAYISIYGLEKEPFLSGFSMLWIRRVLEDVGLIILEARTETFKMHMTIGETTVDDIAKQHVVRAVKHAPEPQKALEWLA
jgi:hypothetical protein